MDSCVLSDWPKDRKGYGYRSVKGKNYFHHRYVYEQETGIDLTPDILIRHTCDNPPCVNIDHLIEGTDLDNIQDRVDRGRSAKGTSHGSNKLTEDDVRWIREHQADYLQKELANMFGVSQNIISKIVRKVIWTHI